MQSLVRSSSNIYKALTERFSELNVSQSQIIKDAKELGFSMHLPQLNRYINKDVEAYGLTEKQILFLCLRYGVDIKMGVKTNEYNEIECIKKVKTIFKK